MDKNEIRNFIRQKKKKLSRAEIEHTGTLIAENVFALPEYAAANIILSYMAINQEVITTPVIGKALKDGKSVGIPKTFGNHYMDFFVYDAANLSVGFGGIPEPAFTNNPIIPETAHISTGHHISAESQLSANSQLSPKPRISAEPRILSDSGTNVLILIPGLAFGRDMNRIGYGGGYYDSYLEKHPNITKAALCYNFQLFNTLPCEKHDIKMDLIITEKEIVR